MNLFVQKSCLTVLLYLALNVVAFVSAAAGDREQLIIFVQPDVSMVDRVFCDKQVPLIKKQVESMGVSVHVVDVVNGVPPEVSITPLVVFQNFRGRSIYQGRTTTLKRIENFVRTARFVPQKNDGYKRSNMAVRQRGRSNVWALVKISGVTGNMPENYIEDQFVNESMAVIINGFNAFQLKKQTTLRRSDRGFYMDFYPWLSDDKMLFLSLALFSQFDCKEPVFKTGDKPLTAPWKDRKELFTRAAARMEKEIEKIMDDPEGGDGFTVIPAHSSVTSWEAIGFPLPLPEKKEAQEIRLHQKIPKNWVLAEKNQDGPPVIQFRFAEPLDQYRGEVNVVNGQFHLAKDSSLDGVAGFLEADTRSITMGDAQLDKAIQGSIFLAVKKYPSARFDINTVTTEDPVLVYGQLTFVDVQGVFSLKGKRLPLKLRVEVEPFIGKNMNPLVMVRGSFKIDVRDFEIEGADGPEPAKYTLEFDINLSLKPKTA